jgi:hypothetical protein
VAEIQTRASLGTVKDFGYTIGETPEYSQKPYDLHFQVMLDMFRNDPVIQTAFDITVEAVTNNSFKFIGENDKLIKFATRQFFDVYDFDRVLDNLLYQLLIHGNSFLELRRENDKIIELHPLETTEMDVQYDEHGEVVWYIQKPRGGGTKSDWIYFSPENIIWFKAKWIGSRVWSYNPLDPIANAYSTKLYAFNYLKLIFQNLPPKLIYILNAANKEQQNEFANNLRRSKTNPHEDLIVKTIKGAKDEFDVREFQVKFDEGLMKVLEFLRNEVLMITRVPPDWIGGQDSSRSQGEFKIYPFEIRIRKLQSIFESEINKKLLPQLNMQNVEFKFNPISFTDEKTIMEVANVMKALGLEATEDDQEHPVVAYLKDKGFPIPSYTRIPTAEEMLQRGLSVGDGETATGQTETAPSRSRMNTKTDKQTSNLDRKGVSAEGKAKAEETKVKS